MATEKGETSAEKGETASEKEKGVAAAEKGETVAENEEGAATEVVVAKEVADGKMITLISLEGEGLEISEAAARQSVHLSGMIDGGRATNGVALSISSKALGKVVEYCNKHAATPDSDPAVFCSAAPDELLRRKWDDKLVGALITDDQDVFFDLVEAADYLKIEGLLDAACKKIADTMKRKTPDEIRAIFNFPNDYTKEEEKELLREHAWAFDDPDNPNDQDDLDDPEDPDDPDDLDDPDDPDDPDDLDDPDDPDDPDD